MIDRYNARIIKASIQNEDHIGWAVNFEIEFDGKGSMLMIPISKLPQLLETIQANTWDDVVGSPCVVTVENKLCRALHNFLNVDIRMELRD